MNAIDLVSNMSSLLRYTVPHADLDMVVYSTLPDTRIRQNSSELKHQQAPLL